MASIALQVVNRIGSLWLGVVIPAAVFALSFFIAFALFRHFTRQAGESHEHRRE